MAKARGSGVWATSAPRMLNAQARACGSDTTSASARSFATSARMRASLSSAASPAKRTSCTVTAPSGGAGRSAQMASIKSGSTATSVAPAAAQALPNPPRPLDRRQRGVEAEPTANREILLDPPIRRRVHQVLDREQRDIHLLACLQRVASVDEQQRALHQHDGDAGRAGKAGQPGESLLGRGHVFVLMAV